MTDWNLVEIILTQVNLEQIIKMENRIRKAIREQIKKLHEASQALQVTAPDGTVAMITDPRDIGDFISGKGIVYGEDQDGASVELHIDSALDYHYVANEGIKEWGGHTFSTSNIGDTNDPRRTKDIEFDKAQAMDQLTPDDKDKLGKIQQMMDKEKSLKEKATELGYLDEEVDEQGLDQIEMGLNSITDGGRQSAGVSDRGDKIRVMFRYMRGEFDGETWEAILEYLSDNMGYKILDQSNYYEANYDREEPAEAVPTIYLQK